MELRDALRFAETLRSNDVANSVTVKISYNQNLQLVVNELLEKYKFNVARNDTEWATAFEKVLSYYLDKDEMKNLLSNTTTINS